MVKIITFDVDGTLVYGIDYIWKLFHEHFKNYEEANFYTKSYFSGKISYDEWVKEHLNLTLNKNGINEEGLINLIKDKTYLLKNTKETLEQLRFEGYKLAVLSGSLNLTLKSHGLEKYFDIIFINKLFIENNNSWYYKATEYDLEKKGEGISQIASYFNT